MEEFLAKFVSIKEEHIILILLIIILIIIAIYKIHFKKSSNNVENTENVEKEENKEKEKIVKYIKKYKNGLVENYIDKNHRFFTINGKRIPDSDRNRIIYYDENYFLLQDRLSEFSYNFTEASVYVKAKLYDYSGKIIVVDSVELSRGSIETMRDMEMQRSNTKLEKQLLKELNDNIKIFIDKYLYSKESKKIIKLGDEEKVSLDGEEVIITFPEGEEIRFNSKLEQINSENGIVYVGEYL